MFDKKGRERGKELVKRDKGYLGQANLEGGGNEGVEVVRVTKVEVLLLNKRFRECRNINK